MDFKIFNNDSAVSPVIATLVLIVVAIIGAAAVGALLGAFSGNVGNQANAQDTASAASTTLVIAGSTHMQPAVQLLASGYMQEHPGIKITVQGGGSDAGISGVRNEILDIGMSTRNLTASEIQSGLISWEGGCNPDVFIVNSNFTLPTDTQQTPELNGTFESGTGVGNLSGITKVFIFASADRNADVINFLKAANPNFDFSVNCDSSATTEQQMIEKVGATPNSIGFTVAVYGKINSDKVKIVSPITWQYDVVNNKPITFTSNQIWILTQSWPIDPGFGPIVPGPIVPGPIVPGDPGNPADPAMINELKGVSGSYPMTMLQPLNYITKGTPDTLAQSFINYARSPAGATAVKNVGYLPINGYL